ncbi:MAG: CBS domain-containing protein [Pseudonocardiaceae bacterium]
MAKRLVDIGPEESLRSVAQELVADEIGAVLVRVPGGPVGLISERDLVTVLVGGGDFDTQQAADIMTADLVTAQPRDSIAFVGRLMLDTGVRHVVVHENDAVVGLVSIRDVLAVLLGSTDAR